MIERYARPPLVELWSDEYKFRRWLEIEILACEAWAELGVLPREAVAALRKRAFFPVDRAFCERVKEIEAEVQHDVIAFTTAAAERLGPEGRYIHYGLTSYDVVDTALSTLMAEAARFIEEDLAALASVLADLAVAHRDTVIMGRTHGVHAEPTSFGLKMALWYAETERNRERMARARAGISYGKLSGAVGNFAHIDPYVEEYVCRRLGLEPAPVSTQILQRDRHAEYVAVLGIIASSVDKFATEIRSLQRTEIRELEEPFGAGQKGSSAMPHKRNPVTCERLSGLARVVRSYVQAALENIPLWHERDISNSSVERIIIPDGTTLVDYMVTTFTRVMKGLRVNVGRMAENADLTKGLVSSQRVMLALVEKGMSREEAYRLVQRRAMEAWEKDVGFREELAGDPDIWRYLSGEELAACFDYRYYLRRVDEIYRRLGLPGR